MVNGHVPLYGQLECNLAGEVLVHELLVVGAEGGHVRHRAALRVQVKLAATIHRTVTFCTYIATTTKLKILFIFLINIFCVCSSCDRLSLYVENHIFGGYCSLDC